MKAFLRESYGFEPKYAYLSGTEVGEAAMAEFLDAMNDGKSKDEAEMIASNYLCRSGINANRFGGISIDFIG